MINPVLQFLYQWTLKSPISGASNDGSGNISYTYRSNKIVDALCGEDMWGIDIYKGDGHFTRSGTVLKTTDTNDFINKYKI